MSDTDDRLRIGLIGAGPWAEKIHAPGIAAHPGMRLAAVWARRADAAAALAGKHGAEVASDPDALIDSVDAVAFAVPPEVQAELAGRAARAGRHLVLEKPIAASVPEAERLVDAATSAGVTSLVMLTRRFAPETRDWLAGLQDGTWAGGDAQWLAGSLLDGPYSSSPWRHERGALYDVGPHTFDLLDAALGPITEVLAARHRPAEDLWQVMFGHRGGATSTAALSLKLPVKPGVAEVSVYGPDGLRTLGSGTWSAQDCYAALLDDLLALILAGTTEHRCDLRRGLHLQRIIAMVEAKISGVAAGA